MGYRRKTCGYCGSNHAVLDCEKLQTDAAEAKQAVAEYDTKFKHLHEKAILYDEAYTYRREQGADGRIQYTYIKNKDRAYVQRRVDYHIHTEYEYNYDSMPDQVSNEEHHEISKYRYKTKRSFQNIVTKNDEVRAKADARSKKSCSYCREAGHTVRTCKVVKADTAMHRTAYQISAYRYAMALSRFGVWTGSMAVREEGGAMPLMASIDNFNPSVMAYDINEMTTSSRRKDPDSYTYTTDSAEAYAKELGITIDDFQDFLYFRNAMCSGIRFCQVGEDGWYTGTTLRVDSSEETNFDQNQYTPNETGIKLYKSSVSVEHIYSVIMSKYNPPQRNGYNGNNRVAWVRSADDAYLSQLDLFAKKKRKVQAYKVMEVFIQNNQDILNKIKELSV